MILKGSSEETLTSLSEKVSELLEYGRKTCTTLVSDSGVSLVNTLHSQGSLNEYSMHFPLKWLSTVMGDV